MKKQKKGFSLIELIAAVAAATVLIVCLSISLVNAHKGYSDTYTKVYGDLATDSFVNTKLFDSVIRKSSLSIKEPQVGDDSDSLDVFCYENVSSSEPDKYASFYMDDNELKIDYGGLDGNGNKLAADNTQTIAKNVEDIKFEVAGSSVKMILTLDDGRQQMTVVCSGVRHAR